MKNIPLIFASVIACMTFASCSQEEQDTRSQVVNAPQQQHTTVEELTAQLKAYNSQFELRQGIVMQATSDKIRLSLKDKIKIALADAVGGGIGALFAGPYGAIAGGAASSYLKRLSIMNKKSIRIENVQDKYADALVGNGVLDNFSDSVGCYHNIIENELHMLYDNKNYKPSNMEIIACCDSKMKTLSQAYRNNKVITISLLNNLCTEVAPISRVSDSDDTSFSMYQNNMKQAKPSQSAYIDYFGEFLFTLAYANIDDPEQYAEEVLRQIKSSNASDLDKEELANGINTAYASFLYSAAINYKYTNQ